MSTPRIDKLDRNIIINGGFDFWQRVGGNTTTINTAATDGSYTSDRFQHYSAGTTVKNFSVSRAADVPTAAQVGASLVYSRKFTCVTAIASMATTDRVIPHIYSVEGYDAAALVGQYGTFGFWVKCNLAGTFPISFVTSLSGYRSYVTTFSIAAGEVGTWIWRTVTVPFEGSNFNLDNTIGLAVRIGTSSGSTYQSASQGQWVSGNYDSLSTTTNLMGTVGNYMQITGVQMVVGQTLNSGSFARAGRTIGHELYLCQRYYEVGYTNFCFNAAGVGTATDVKVVLSMLVTKRANPSMGFVGGSNVTLTSITPTTGANGLTYNQLGLNFSSGNSNNFNGTWTADAEL